MDSLLSAIAGLFTSLITVAIAWGKFSNRIDVLEKRMDEAVTKQDDLNKAMFSLTIEITKLTGEIKELRNAYHNNHEKQEKYERR